MNQTINDVQIYTKAGLSKGDALLLRTGSLIPMHKPLDWTSFDLVNKLRGSAKYATRLKRLKVGHAGTLDPRADGVLLVCTGRATKKTDFLMEWHKEYIAELTFGATTPSFDSEFEPDQWFPYEHITEADLQEILTRFTGTIEQVPPIYSAVSVGGERAYELARAGKEVNLKAKQVVVESIEILSFDLPRVELRINCGRGTYIRSLARDIGQALNSGAYLTRLTRSKVGNITLDDCFDVEQIKEILSHTAIQEDGFDPIDLRTVAY